jgi:hypothetical protein
MAKGGRPDKENMITGMFSKIAREYDRQKKKEIREAKRSGKFYKIDNPELLSIPDQIKYFKDLEKHEGGDSQYKKEWAKDETPKPYHYMHKIK